MDDYYDLSGSKQALFIRDSAKELTRPSYTKFKRCLNTLGFKTDCKFIESDRELLTKIDNKLMERLQDVRNANILDIVNEFLDKSKKVKNLSCLMIVWLGHAVTEEFGMEVTNTIANWKEFATIPKVLICDEWPLTVSEGPIQVEERIIPVYADFLWFQYQITKNIHLTDKLCKYLTKEYFNIYHILDIFTLATNSVKESLEELGNNNSSMLAIETNLPCYKSSLTKLLKLS